MEVAATLLLQDRAYAGRLLSQKLYAYKKSNAVVIGIPNGGVCVAAVIADTLSLTLDVLPCKKMKHPGNNDKYVGSVAPHEVFFHDCSYTIPQDYLHHQVMLLRKEVERDNTFFYGDSDPESLYRKTVILVIDTLKKSDAIMAGIREIKRQSPRKLILAVPIISAEAAHMLQLEVDEIVCLKIESKIHSRSKYFVDFPKVDKTEVKRLLKKSKNHRQILLS